MALLKIKAKAKVIITWGTTNLSFIRDVTATKTTTATYTNATGQSFTAGQVLYTSGTQGVPGYINVKSTTNTTLNGNGVFSISVEHYPTSTEGNKTITFNIDESPLGINLTYNSQPNINDIIVETNNRTTKVFTTADFTAHYSDYDADQIAAVQINGDVTGYKLNNADYVAGAWVSIADIGIGYLTYVPLDQSTYYEKDNTWKAKDSQGNISIN